MWSENHPWPFWYYRMWAREGRRIAADFDRLYMSGELKPHWPVPMVVG